MRLNIDVVSSGAQAHHNEDWAGSFRTPDSIDLVIIDGATSVADRDLIDPVNGDVVWFVTRFALALGATIAAGLDQDAAVHAAVETVDGAFRERLREQELPQYAWPIAALTWVRAREAAGGHALSLYCLGDCKALMRTSDGAIHDLDPFVNPQEAILQAEIARLQSEGVVDAAARKARLMPMLRARRVFQNTAPNTNSLCLRPNGAFGARRLSAYAPRGASVLCMTDGFYRLVDTYALHTPPSLFALCEERGLRAGLEQLRGHEAQLRAADSVTLKRADDASALLWRS